MEEATVDTLGKLLIEEVNAEIDSEALNRDIQMEASSPTSPFIRERDVALQILSSDTPKKIVLKKKISALGLSLATKSTFVRKLQKKFGSRKSRYSN